MSSAIASTAPIAARQPFEDRIQEAVVDRTSMARTACSVTFPALYAIA